MASSIFSKHRRAMLVKSIKGFWEEYSRNRIGLLGLVIVIFYITVAVFAPWLSTHDPMKPVASAEIFAMPEWMTIFPGRGNLPRTMKIPMSWSPLDMSESMNLVESGEKLIVEYNGASTQTANFTSFFLYTYSAPHRFKIAFSWSAQNVINAKYSIELFIANPAGNEYILWTSYTSRQWTLGLSSSSNNVSKSESFYSSALSEQRFSHIRERLGLTGLENICTSVFTDIGEYRLRVQIKVGAESDIEQGTAEIQLEKTQITILGLVYGILGTDAIGQDVYSQLVYGARISLAVGLSSAFLSTAIGILVGVVAGYVGGAVDEILMRGVDVLLALPVLPLLLGLVVVFGTSVWFLVLLIAVFGWLGLSRLIRSRVLSLKEMPFIECAKAAGASKFYTMRKHVLPNVVPVALAAMILSVPAAILTEAGISFIGLGDPTAPTWGKMLHWSFYTGAFSRLIWWWILPPGLAITLLTLAFVFIGHAVDEIVNPRLRRRR